MKFAIAILTTLAITAATQACPVEVQGHCAVQSFAVPQVAIQSVPVQTFALQSFVVPQAIHVQAVPVQQVSVLGLGCGHGVQVFGHGGRVKVFGGGRSTFRQRTVQRIR